MKSKKEDVFVPLVLILHKILEFERGVKGHEGGKFMVYTRSFKNDVCFHQERAENLEGRHIYNII
jgi:hypothetical protein